MMSKKAVFVMSQKGGVGKSTFARCLLDHLRRHTPQGYAAPARTIAFDLQPEVNQLGIAYGIKKENERGEMVYDAPANLSHPFEGVLSLSLRDDKDVEMLGEALDYGADVLLFDLPGGSIDEMKSVFGTLKEFIGEYRSAGYEIVVAMALSYLAASSAGVEEIMKVWGPSVKYVAVLNLGQAPREEFIFFDGERAERFGYPKDRIETAGGVVIEMPSLQQSTYALVDADGVSFSEAADIEKSPYSRTHRVRVRGWLEKMDAQIAKLRLINYSQADLDAFAAVEQR
jgi:hypothetical protein